MYSKPKLNSIQELIKELEVSKECIVGVHTLTMQNNQLMKRVFINGSFSYIPYTETEKLVGEIWVPNLTLKSSHLE